MSENGIFHITMAPYHPLSNGLTERAVQTFKCGFKATQGGSIQETLKMYRIAPHTTTTGLSPAQLLMGCHLRSWLVRLFPNMQKHIQSKRSKQAAYHHNSKPLRSFSVSDQVYTEDISTTPNTWIPGVISLMPRPHLS